jgi:hypothetical protein
MGQALTSCLEEVKPPEVDARWEASYKLPLGAPPAGSLREANPMVYFDITIGRLTHLLKKCSVASVFRC